PTHRKLFAAAISARLKDSDPGADELFQLTLTELDQPLPDGFPARRILAFVAGQWWKTDRRLAEDLWVNALLQIENDPVFVNEPETRITHLTYLIEDATCGAPLLALPVLLASV